MPTTQILQYLKAHGETLDTKIAEATGITLAKTRIHLNELAAKREIMVCDSIRFEKGKEVRNMSCRLAGFELKPKPGPKSKGSKSKVQLVLS
jgi:hypothetical protein